MVSAGVKDVLIANEIVGAQWPATDMICAAASRLRESAIVS